jgi:hypothetical protein
MRRMGKKKKKNVVATLSEVARQLEISTRTVESWRRRPNPLPGGQGAYDIDEIREWMVCEGLQRKEEPDFASDIGEDGDEPTAKKFQKLQFELEKAKTRKEKALAAQHEIKAKLIDPEFVSSLEVNQFFGEFFAELRRNLLAIPVDMCAAYPTSYRAAVQKDLTNRAELFLNQMGDFVDRFNQAHQPANALDTQNIDDQHDPTGSGAEHV